jgi:hypothetical protein
MAEEMKKDEAPEKGAEAKEELDELRKALEDCVKAGVKEEDIKACVHDIIRGDEDKKDAKEDDKDAAKEFGLPGFVN